jgi:fatty-acyl-CoA synthase
MRAMTLELHDHSLSYVHGASEVPLIGTTIGDLFDRVAAQLPDHEALVSRHQNLRFTYAGLRDACDRLARGLLALGVTKG